MSNVIPGNSFARCGQINEEETGLIKGIGRYVSSGNGISEGQWDDDGYYTGFGRFIWNDGTFHIGWWYQNSPRGYGIGNFYTNGYGIKQGLYDDYVFVGDGEVSYDLSEIYAQKFDMESLFVKSTN